MDQSTAAAIRREIPGVLLRIGSTAAEGVLTESLLDGDTVLRFRVLTALNKLRAAGSSRPLDVKLVETVLAAEVMGHLRSYQILGTLDYAANSSEPVAQGLRESMMQEVERIFRLVKLLSPVYDLESAYVGLQSSKRDIHDNALEFLENILKPQLRTLLLPLLDSDVSVQQRVALANRTLGTTRLHAGGSSRAPRRERRPVAAGLRRVRDRHAASRLAGPLSRALGGCGRPAAEGNREAGQGDGGVFEHGHAQVASGVRIGRGGCGARIDDVASVPVMWRRDFNPGQSPVPCPEASARPAAHVRRCRC